MTMFIDRSGIRNVLLVIAVVSCAPTFAQESRQEAEKRIRQQIEAEIKVKETKVKALEAELELVRSKLNDRKKNIELIVKQRVDSSLALSKANDPSATDDSADELAAAAWLLWQKQKYAEARPKFQRAVELSPKNANTWNGLGWSNIHLGAHEKAREAFKKTLELMPNHGGARNGMGQSYLAEGKLADATRELLKATEDIIEEFGEKEAIRNQMTVSWITLVDVYLRQGEKEKAKQWADRYLKHAPDDANMKKLQERISKP